MGSHRHYSEEAPIHRATVDGFFIDRMLATDRELSRSVNATGYATFAEQKLDAEIYLNALPPGQGRFAHVHAVRACGGHA
jgi:formylglycine-generating enzyme